MRRGRRAGRVLFPMKLSKLLTNPSLMTREPRLGSQERTLRKMSSRRPRPLPTLAPGSVVRTNPAKLACKRPSVLAGVKIARRRPVWRRVVTASGSTVKVACGTSVACAGGSSVATPSGSSTACAGGSSVATPSSSCLRSDDGDGAAARPGDSDGGEAAAEERRASAADSESATTAGSCCSRFTNEA